MALTGWTPQSGTQKEQKVQLTPLQTKQCFSLQFSNGIENNPQKGFCSLHVVLVGQVSQLFEFVFVPQNPIACLSSSILLPV